MPSISVIMSVYNEREDYLRLSVESILSQTYSDFEFIIVKDYVDNSVVDDVLASYTDDRIIILKNDENIGLARSLNRAVEIATGEYLARMDSDDISMRERFQRQIEFLLKNDHIALVGTFATKIESTGMDMGTMAVPVGVEAISKCVNYGGVSIHPSWMLRRSVFEKLCGYTEYIYTQDYDFFFRLVKAGYLADNIPEPLIGYRIGREKLDKNKIFMQRRIGENVRSGRDFEDFDHNKKSTSLFVRRELYFYAQRIFLIGINFKENKKYVFAFLMIFFSCFISPDNFSYVVEKLLLKYTAKKYSRISDKRNY